MPQKREVDWDLYGKIRNLSRNRLLFPRHLEPVEDFLKLFGSISNDKKVLDIGPGNGFFMVLLRELGFVDVEGFEISPEFLNVLRSKNLTAHLGNIITGDGVERLSPPYDAILMMEVLEHLEEPERALKNARELIDNDGLLYLTVPICDSIFDRFSRVRHGISREEQVFRIDETHIHAFSPQDLVQLLLRTGFEVRKLRRVSFTSPPFVSYRRDSRVFLLLRALMPNSFRGLFLSVKAVPVSIEDE